MDETNSSCQLKYGLGVEASEILFTFAHTQKKTAVFLHILCCSQYLKICYLESQIHVSSERMGCVTLQRWLIMQCHTVLWALNYKFMAAQQLLWLSQKQVQNTIEQDSSILCTGSVIQGLQFHFYSTQENMFCRVFIVPYLKTHW